MRLQCCRRALRRGEGKCALRYSAKRILCPKYYIDKRISAGDEDVESGVQTSAQHSYTCSYQGFSTSVSLEIATHKHSPSKPGRGHLLVLACEYATTTSYIPNSLLFWTKLPSTHYVDRENDKQTSPCTPSGLYYTRSIVQVWGEYTFHAYTIIA